MQTKVTALDEQTLRVDEARRLHYKVGRAAMEAQAAMERRLRRGPLASVAATGIMKSVSVSSSVTSTHLDSNPRGRRTECVAWRPSGCLWGIAG